MQSFNEDLKTQILTTV